MALPCRRRQPAQVASATQDSARRRSHAISCTKATKSRGAEARISPLKAVGTPRDLGGWKGQDQSFPSPQVSGRDGGFVTLCCWHPPPVPKSSFSETFPKNFHRAYLGSFSSPCLKLGLTLNLVTSIFNPTRSEGVATRSGGDIPFGSVSGKFPKGLILEPRWRAIL